jgi:hypothetical protein
VLPPQQRTIVIYPEDVVYATAVYASTPPIVFPYPQVTIVAGRPQRSEPYLVLAGSDAGMVLVPKGSGSPVGPGDPARLGELLKSAYAASMRVDPASVQLGLDKEDEDQGVMADEVDFSRPRNPLSPLAFSPPSRKIVLPRRPAEATRGLNPVRGRPRSPPPAPLATP